MRRGGRRVDRCCSGMIVGVQGRSDDQRDLLDAESVAGHLLKAGSVFGFLAAHRQELFPDEMFADLFPSGRGRPSVPADVMASGDHVAGVAWVVGQRDRGCGDLRSAVEGRVRAGGHRGGVSPHDVDVLAAPVGGLGLARTGSSTRSRRWSRRPGCWREDPPGVGFHDPRRRGGHPGHGDPADRGDPPGPPRGARRGGGHRRPLHALMITTTRVNRRSPGTTRPPGTGWSMPWSATRTGCWGTCPSRNWCQSR